MSSGEKVRLGDVLKIVNGKNQKAVEDKNGKYPIYGSGGQMGWANSYLCPADTVIIGRKGSINKPLFVTMPFWNVDTAFGLVANSELLSPRYLFHFCKFFDFEKLNTTCTIPSLTRKNIDSIEIDLPELGIQKQAVSQLDRIIAEITVAERQIAQLDQLVKSRFVEMFGEEKYNSIPLTRCCDYAAGGATPSMKNSEFYGGEVPFIKSGDVKGDVVTRGALSLTDVALQKGGAKLTPAGSVLVVTRSALLKNRLHTAFAPISVVINQDIKAFHPTDAFTPSYLMWAIRDKEAVLLHGVRSVNTSSIKTSDLYSLPIPVPPLALQQNFAAFVAQVDKTRAIAQRQIDKLQTLYDSLAQDYFA